MSQKKLSNTSSLTPSDATKKTESALKVVALAGLQASIILLITSFLFGWWRNDTTQITLGAATIQARVADTDAERAIGLGGRKSLANTQGMLFVFPYDNTWSMWMKNMQVAIDMVWLDADKKVVAVEHTVHPQSYPDTFTPPTEARYVLEVAAGVARAAKIEPGIIATFDVSNLTK